MLMKAALLPMKHVKQSIVQQVNALQLKQLFIPGHPMAGKETTGFKVHQQHYLTKPCTLVKQQHAIYNELLFLQQWSVNIIEIEPSQHDLLVAHLRTFLI